MHVIKESGPTPMDSAEMAEFLRIEREVEDRISTRKSYVVICEGDINRAVVLSYIVFRTSKEMREIPISADYLSARFGISRNKVRRAIEWLRREGLIITTLQKFGEGPVNHITITEQVKKRMADYRRDWARVPKRLGTGAAIVNRENNRGNTESEDGFRVPPNEEVGRVERRDAPRLSALSLTHLQTEQEFLLALISSALITHSQTVDRKYISIRALEWLQAYPLRALREDIRNALEHYAIPRRDGLPSKPLLTFLSEWLSRPPRYEKFPEWKLAQERRYREAREQYERWEREAEARRAEDEELRRMEAAITPEQRQAVEEAEHRQREEQKRAKDAAERQRQEQEAELRKRYASFCDRERVAWEALIQKNPPNPNDPFYDPDEAYYPPEYHEWLHQITASAEKLAPEAIEP